MRRRELAIFTNGNVSKFFIEVNSGEQFAISFKGTVKKQSLGIREILEIFLGNTGT